jgi:ornithine cyclodeaminase/alanine dehydrogenase-like protein (mu-crystallin family)
MAATRVLTQDCIAGIVRRVGLDAFLDELITRFVKALADHDPEVMQTIMRTGFRYSKPDFGLVEWMPVMEVGRRASIKTVGYHPKNPVERAAPSVLATTSLYDTTDGRLLALCEATFLTALRTGAVSAVVSDVLAVPGASMLGVVGCGAQSVTQIHAISRVRPIERILAFDADESVAATLARRVDRAGVSALVEVVASAEEVLSEVDILCVATSVETGLGPVVSDGSHRPWLHINAVGADHPGKFELPATLLRRAVVIPDLVEQCLLEGESQHVPERDLGPDLPSLVRHRDRHEAKRAELTVFDSTGWALEDLIAAELVLDHGERLGEGFVLDLQPVPLDPYDPYEFLCE